MGHYFFVADLKDGKVAEKVVRTWFEDTYSSFNLKSTELERKEQNFGDFRCNSTMGEDFTVEVKFDRMAEKTGNMCFEVTNGKGDMTGIAKTQADNVAYLVPGKEEKVSLFLFKAEALKKYLFDPLNSKKIKHVKGGDRRAYGLMLVKISTLISDGVPYSVEEISAEL